MKKSVNFYKGNFGLERETLRVDAQGHLAQTPHPFGDDPHITRDFCENQIELITPVCGGVADAVKSLGELAAAADRKLAENGERIWLYSNPPRFETEADIPIAAFGGEQSSKRDYRENLQRRYGKRLMLFSGVHFNFSFADELISEWHAESPLSLRRFKDELYLRLYRQISRYSWLMVMLTAASPYYDISLDGDHLAGTKLSPYSSMRNSVRGYWNEFTPLLDHSSLKAFTDGIAGYVRKGMLFSASELYLPVRLKPRGVNTLEGLAQGGVDHIELRMFDLDPLTETGVDEKMLDFAHLLMLWLLTLDDCEFDHAEQSAAWQAHKNAALYDLSGVTVDGVDIRLRAAQVLDEMESFFSGDSHAHKIISYARDRLKNRLCRRISAEDIYGSSAETAR